MLAETITWLGQWPLWLKIWLWPCFAIWIVLLVTTVSIIIPGRIKDRGKISSCAMLMNRLYEGEKTVKEIIISSIREEFVYYAGLAIFWLPLSILALLTIPLWAN
jgi:hypothetical protein